MRSIIIALALTLGATLHPQPAAAQPGRTQPHADRSARQPTTPIRGRSNPAWVTLNAGGGWIGGAYGWGYDHAVEVSAGIEVPFSPEWKARAHFSTNRWNPETTYLRSVPSGPVRHRRIALGLMRTLRGDDTTYGIGGISFHDYHVAETGARFEGVGIFGGIGADVPVSDTFGVLVEFIGNLHDRPVLGPVQIPVVSLSLNAGFRVRF